MLKSTLVLSWQSISICLWILSTNGVLSKLNTTIIMCSIYPNWALEICCEIAHTYIHECNVHRGMCVCICVYVYSNVQYNLDAFSHFCDRTYVNMQSKSKSLYWYIPNGNRVDTSCHTALHKCLNFAGQWIAICNAHHNWIINFSAACRILVIYRFFLAKMKMEECSESAVI